MRSRIPQSSIRAGNRQRSVALACVLLFLLSSAAMTLGLSPNLQFSLLSAGSTRDARTRYTRRPPLTKLLSTIGSALSKPHSRLIKPTALVNTFSVITTADNGSNTSPTPGSLREAIVSANAANGGAINFNIPGDGVHIITPPVSLPDITAPVTIDGYTQPGTRPNTLADGDDAVLLIVLNGNGVGGLSGLNITTANCTVRGLVINGFNGNGIALFESAATNNHIEGNFIGTNTSGTAAVGNSTGVYFLRANGNQIGGADPAARNVISGNINVGISIQNGGGATGAGNVIQGNYIGTNASGTAALPNIFGLLIDSDQNNIIGGTIPGAGNLVSGNLNQGIRIASSFPAASGNVIQGNLIGTDISGLLALGNGSWGVDITTVQGGPTATNNTIGGSSTAARNVIAGNAAGVRIGGDSNAVQGNLIGVSSDGVTALGNHGDGLMINGNNNQIGGAAGGAANVIAFSGTPNQNDRGHGVFVSDGTGNVISGNSIFANGNPNFPTTDRGIALGSVAMPNDSCDADTGSNNLQNYPVLASATSNGTTTTIEGTLNSTPNTQFSIEFFANDACHPSGFGEGKTFIGSATLTTNANCYVDFNGSNAVVLQSAVAAGQVITATATDAAGNTSEFSQCIAATVVTPPPEPATHFSVSAPASATAGSAFSVTVIAQDQFNNTATGYSGTVHFSSSDGAATLPANSTLTNGVGTFNATLKTAGNQTITATDTVTSSITGTSNTIAVSANAATHFSVSAPASGTGGSAFSFTVTAQDQFNNTATGYSGAVRFSSTDGAATLPAKSTLTKGVGTFSATLKSPGNQTITATDSANISITGTSNNITVGAAVATHFGIIAPANATAGTNFTFTVKALDQSNNIANGYSGTVHFSSSDSQAVLPSDSALANGAGSFSATLKSTGNQTITATDTVNNSITGVSNAILVTGPRPGFAITSFVFSGGGGSSSGGSFDLLGTGGQYDIGFSRGGANTLDTGFWQSGAAQTFAPASTPVGADVVVRLGGIAINFGRVTAPGLTIIQPTEPCQPGGPCRVLPAGYTVLNKGRMP